MAAAPSAVEANTGNLALHDVPDPVTDAASPAIVTVGAAVRSSSAVIDSVIASPTLACAVFALFEAIVTAVKRGAWVSVLTVRIGPVVTAVAPTPTMPRTSIMSLISNVTGPFGVLAGMVKKACQLALLESLTGVTDCPRIVTVGVCKSSVAMKINLTSSPISTVFPPEPASHWTVLNAGATLSGIVTSTQFEGAD